MSNIKIKQVIKNLIKKLYGISPSLFILLSFMVVILAGAVLLCLPVSSVSGGYTPFIDSLFTATSATCVTGLAVYDTYTHWSLFGQTVILCLIQIGGLGVMSVVSIVSFVLRRRFSFKERELMAATISLENIQGVAALMKRVLIMTLVFEGIGAALLCIRFIPQFGAAGIFKGIFHSVSAFCNAGFDIMGEIAPDSSLSIYALDPLVNITIMALIIAGGLGFFVINDLCDTRKISKLSLHTKLVISVTTLLIFGGAALFFVFERNNAFADMPVWGKLMAAFFQSVTTRTAGFFTVNQASFSDNSQLVSMLLMIVGGSPGSTAGGIKTVTVGVLVLAVIASAKGSRDISVFKRRIDPNTVLRAIAVTAITVAVLVVSVLVLSATQTTELKEAVFEATSAIATVGLSTGLTAKLDLFGKCVVALLMYFGRVGALSVVIAFVSKINKSNLYRYPEGRILIG